MMGRAGRPQYDTEGVAVVMVPSFLIFQLTIILGGAKQKKLLQKIHS